MLTKQDLRNIQDLLQPKFENIHERLTLMGDDIHQLNRKMDDGFERIYRYLSGKLEIVENTGELNSVDIDMIKNRMLREKASVKYKKLKRFKL